MRSARIVGRRASPMWSVFVSWCPPGSCSWLTPARAFGAEASCELGVDAESTGPQDDDDEGERGKREVELVTARRRFGVDAVRPRDGDHRHHHVDEQRSRCEAGAEPEHEGDAADELDQPGGDGEEPSRPEMG